MRIFKRTLSFVSLLIIAIGMAQATPRSVQQAKKIAQQHALKMGIALQPDGLTQKAVKASKIAAAPGAHPTVDSYCGLQSHGQLQYQPSARCFCLLYALV